MNIENLSSHISMFQSDLPRIAQHLPDIKGQGVDGDLRCSLTYRLSLLFGGYDGGLCMVVCTRVMLMVIYLESNHEHVGE